MYESPIRIIEHIEQRICGAMEDEIYKTVVRMGIDVNKEELVKALKYDRQQYLKGYHDGQPGWIPCSVGMPEEDGEYLCDYNGHIHIGQMINGHFRHYGEIVDHLIIAWQPLPEPWGGEAE